MRFQSIALLSLFSAASAYVDDPNRNRPMPVAPEQCGKVTDCYLHDHDSGKKIKLQRLAMEVRHLLSVDYDQLVHSHVMHGEYEITQFTSFSLYCETEGQMDKLSFSFRDETGELEKHEATEAPFYSAPNGKPDAFLNRAGEKDLTVYGFLKDRKNPCFNVHITLACEYKSACSQLGTPTMPFHLIAKHSQLALNIAEGKTDNGADIIQFAKTNAKNDNWFLQPTPGTDKFCHIVSEHSTKVLRGVNGNLVQWEQKPTAEDDWCMIFVDQEWIQIRNRASKKCIGIKGGSTTTGETAVVETCTGEESQLFVPKISTDVRNGGKPVLAPTVAPTAVPTPAPQTLMPVAIHPPKPPACYLWNNKLYYGLTTVRTDYEIDVNFGANNAKWLKFKPRKGYNYIYVPDKSDFNGWTYSRGSNTGFFMRFFNAKEQVAGHWQYCRNYNYVSKVEKVSLAHIPAKCYLWGTRFWYDAYVPKGSVVEVETFANKSFQYITTHENEKWLYNKQARYDIDRRGFKIRIRVADDSAQGYHYAKTAHSDKDGYMVCKNFTPIAIDLNKDNEVSKVSGEFYVDVTGDGNINYLSEWFAPEEGILVNLEGVVNGTKIDGQDLFGDMGGKYADGFDKLAEHDTDKNGYVEGAELDGLGIWIDSDSNCIVDEEDELYEFSDFGIVALHVFDTDLVSYAKTADGNLLKMQDLLFAKGTNTTDGNN